MEKPKRVLNSLEKLKREEKGFLWQKLSSPFLATQLTFFLPIIL